MNLLNKQIADMLTLIASHIPPEVDDTVVVCVYREGNFRIKCKPTRAAVLAVAEKYRKGGPRSFHVHDRGITVPLHADGRTKQVKNWGFPAGKTSPAALAKRYANDSDLDEFLALIAPVD